MLRYIAKHFIDTIWHKLWVVRAGLAIGGIGLRRLIAHDWSKFSDAERVGYASRWHKPVPKGQDLPWGDKDAWERALAHHYRTNDHHPQFWGATPDMDITQVAKARAKEMPEVAIREMVADWLAATACRNGGFPASAASWEWWGVNKDRLPVSSGILARATVIISEFFETIERRKRIWKAARLLLVSAACGALIVGAGFHVRAYSNAGDTPVWAYVYQWFVIALATIVIVNNGIRSRR